LKISEILKGRSKKTSVQFVRYIFVGGAAAAVQYLILIILAEAFSVNKVAAAAAGFIGGLVVNYIISVRWVFEGSGGKSKAAEFTVFSLIGVVGLLINELFIWFFDVILSDKNMFGGIIPTDKYYLAGQLIATAAVFFWNFFARKILLYSKENPNEGTGKN